MKTAIVLGASGLVGSTLVNQLLETPEYDKIKVFVRRTLTISHPKLEEHLVDFDNLTTWKQDLVGYTLFSCMGTTLKTAGSKEKQYIIDFTYPYQCIEAAIEKIKQQMVTSMAICCFIYS